MRWYVRLTWWMLRALGMLPLPALYAIGSVLGHLLWWRKHARERVHTEVNMRIVWPGRDDAARGELVRACLLETGHAVTEMAAVWGRGARRALALVREVEGLEHFDAALRSGRGLIIAAPHLGCWELLNHWLRARTPITILYAPPRNPAWEALLVRARGDLEPEQVRADGAGVRTLYKRLAAGGVVGILPDQQPKRGEGQFAPFFGLEANTMVLLPRIARRTGATVLFAFAARLPRGAGFRIRILPAPDGIADQDLRVACTALNSGVQKCVELVFPQYQWTYKRWAERPDPNEHDPYWLARNGVTEQAVRAGGPQNRGQSALFSDQHHPKP
jgi:KDO2-lipid IV(A) lauroyltransferase